MADEAKTQRGTITKTAIPTSVSNRSNTTLSGNQGSPQPGAPKSHSVSRTGIGTHRVGAIQKLAMALPCSQWKGETKQSESWTRKSEACLKEHSDTAKMSAT